MKKEIEVKLYGLNELGAKEMNEFYKRNIKECLIDKFEIGDFKSPGKKRFKQYKSFMDLGLENHIMTFDVCSASNGGWFEMKLKHFKHEIFELILTETKITL